MNLHKPFERIQLWKKFICLELLFIALIIAPFFLYWNEVNKSLSPSIKEQQGLPPIRLMLDIIQYTQQYRALAAHFLQDNSISASAQRKKAEELEEAIFSYEKYLSKNPNASYEEAFKRSVAYWHSIHQSIAQKKLGYDESFTMLSALIDMHIQYVQSLVDLYQLSLDSNADGYFLAQATFIELPELIEALAQVQTYGVSLLIKGNATPDERAQLKALMYIAETKVRAVEAALRKVELTQRKMSAEENKTYQPAKKQFETLREIVKNDILEKEEFYYSSENFYALTASLINDHYNYIYSGVEKLDILLAERVQTEKNKRYKTLFYFIGPIFLALVIGVVFFRNLLRQLGGEPKNISEVLKAITRGDLDSEIETRHSESVLAHIKNMQESLKKSDELKTAFIATASHELKTPLTAIGSALSLTVDGQLGSIPEPALTHLGVAQRNSVRLAELIDEFLDINKLSVGRLELDMHVQPLMPIIDDTKLSMTSYAQKHGVQIVVGPRFEYLLVNVDSRRLRQVLKNLLSNAARFSKKGEEIVINISVHSETVRIEVIDHGCGISDEQKDKIFQKYVRETSSGSAKGLGLAISRELVLAMGGEIGFTSSIGSGSCFYVDLPLEEPNSD